MRATLPILSGVPEPLARELVPPRLRLCRTCEGMATTRKLSVDGSVKEYKVPLEATPSFLSNNLCSTTSTFDDAPSSEAKCILLYSSGNSSPSSSV